MPICDTYGPRSDGPEQFFSFDRWSSRPHYASVYRADYDLISQLTTSSEVQHFTWLVNPLLIAFADDSLILMEANEKNAVMLKKKVWICIVTAQVKW
jgi:hypothetical protein